MRRFGSLAGSGWSSRGVAVAVTGHFSVALRQSGASEMLMQPSACKRRLKRKNIPRRLAAAPVWFSRRRTGWRKILNHARQLFALAQDGYIDTRTGELATRPTIRTI